MDLKTRLMGAPSILAMRSAADEIARLEHENEKAHRELSELRGQAQELMKLRDQVQKLERALLAGVRENSDWIEA